MGYKEFTDEVERRINERAKERQRMKRTVTCRINFNMTGVERPVTVNNVERIVVNHVGFLSDKKDTLTTADEMLKCPFPVGYGASYHVYTPNLSLHFRSEDVDVFSVSVKQTEKIDGKENRN